MSDDEWSMMLDWLVFRDALRRLANNLVVAATLCRAWKLGNAAERHVMCMTDGLPCIWQWHPGCGRSAP